MEFLILVGFSTRQINICDFCWWQPHKCGFKLLPDLAHPCGPSGRRSSEWNHSKLLMALIPEHEQRLSFLFPSFHREFFSLNAAFPR